MTAYMPCRGRLTLRSALKYIDVEPYVRPIDVYENIHDVCTHALRDQAKLEDHPVKTCPAGHVQPHMQKRIDKIVSCVHVHVPVDASSYRNRRLQPVTT